MNGFTATFLAALAISVALQTWLAIRQVTHVRAHRSSVPSPFRDRVPLEVHQKAADYTVARTRLAVAATAVDAAVLLAWTLAGGLDRLDRAWRMLELTPALAGAGLIVSALLLTALLRLPLFAYAQFVIEERHGFNRLAARLFLADTIKKGFLLAAVAAPLAAVVVWLMENTGGRWWLYVWAMWTAFVVARMWAYPTLVAPLFNHFTPLRDEGLRIRIAGLLERCGLVLDRVFVMDGSRRSSHGNAYVSGVGSGKRIVLLDTLLDTLDPEEIEAVLAHEVGHVKHRHLLRYLAATSLVSLGALLLLAELTGRPGFTQGLGVSQPSSHAALALFLLAWPVFGVFLKPLASAALRRFEFEADAFAARYGDPQALIRALVKLYRANATSLTPDPLYSTFHHAHPPPVARIESLVGAPGNGEI